MTNIKERERQKADVESSILRADEDIRNENRDWMTGQRWRYRTGR